MGNSLYTLKLKQADNTIKESQRGERVRERERQRLRKPTSQPARQRQTEREGGSLYLHHLAEHLCTCYTSVQKTENKMVMADTGEKQQLNKGIKAAVHRVIINKSVQFSPLTWSIGGHDV